MALVAIREEGGQVVRVNNLRGERVFDPRTGIIEGVVLDSLGVEAVEGAVVILDGPRRAKTDADGRFRFSSLTQGRYGARVSNTALDTLGLTPGEVSSVRLQSPALIASRITLCDQAEVPEGKGVLVGYVHDASGDPAVGVDIRITWQEVVRFTPGRFSPNELTTQDWESNLTVGREDGFYWACGVPIGALVENRSDLERRRVGASSVSLSRDRDPRPPRRDRTVGWVNQYGTPTTCPRGHWLLQRLWCTLCRRDSTPKG